MSEGSNRDTKFWIGFFIGGLLGAIILFFLGTKEGKKTGKMLEEKGQDFLDELEDRLADLEKKGRDLAKQGEALKEEVIEQVEDKKDEVSHGVVKKLDSALAHIEALQEHGRETTADLRKKLFKNTPKKS
ncbi:YtxH domain-containing protein [Candidatus Gottesmanbacteria bacterium]|nr:YtxH domain-containing protein [Candidatus Gottesmanbacteria bacterium]